MTAVQKCRRKRPSLCLERRRRKRLDKPFLVACLGNVNWPTSYGVIGLIFYRNQRAIASGGFHKRSCLSTRKAVFPRGRHLVRGRPFLIPSNNVAAVNCQRTNGAETLG